MEKHEVDIAVQDMYAFLEEQGCNPLTIAASFMVSAFLIYANQLSKDDYRKVVEGVFNKADVFVTKQYSRMN